MTAPIISEAVCTTWYEANQDYLTTAFSGLRNRLDTALRNRSPEKDSKPPVESEPKTAFTSHPWSFSEPPAIEQLCSSFGLSSFERDVLLLCASAEMDARITDLLASLDSGRRPLPTFGLALCTLCDAHWSALSPARPLRLWHLVDLLPADTLVSTPLRINERVLHYLVGVDAPDERLQSLIHPLPYPDVVPSSYRETAQQIAAIWSDSTTSESGSASISRLPIIELCGDESEAKRAIATTAAALLSLRLSILNPRSLPQTPTSEINLIVRLWEREARLGDNALLIEWDEKDAVEASTANILPTLLDSIHSPLILSTNHSYTSLTRAHLVFHITKPTRAEQAEIWDTSLVGQNINGTVAALVSQFSLTPIAIRSAARRAIGVVRQSSPPYSKLEDELWDACRLQGRSSLAGLAQRIEPVATWDDLVLTEKDKQLLHRIPVHVRQRTKVYDSWGFASKVSRGLGISALFAGASGTGKTMAAEVLAHTLRLDLFRIDLSQVVSKYIGETEKTLSRVFDAAEEGAAVLLFDEADALFGKRSEVKDSHDRYANVEVSYLLQRMEAYRGLAILTTNRKSALDHAFLRRIRFVVDFSFPAEAQRAEIWRHVFPLRTPTEDLDIDRLARLRVSGGHIHNIAMGAAFLAADADQPVRMEHLLSSARSEFAKLDTPLTDAEVAGWA